MASTTIELGLKTLIIMVRFCVCVSRPHLLRIMPQKNVRVSCLVLIENFGLASFDLFFTSGPSAPMVFVPLPTYVKAGNNILDTGNNILDTYTRSTISWTPIPLNNIPLATNGTWIANPRDLPT